jgi:hypothetical protein
MSNRHGVISRYRTGNKYSVDKVYCRTNYELYMAILILEMKSGSLRSALPVMVANRMTLVQAFTPSSMFGGGSIDQTVPWDQMGRDI